jgi:hypothetical protein
MICRTAVATFSLSLSEELGDCTDGPVFEIPVVADAAARGAVRFSHLSALPVIAVVECLGAL